MGVSIGKALVKAPLVGVATQLDIRLHGVDPWKIVAGTAGATLFVAYLYNLTQQRVPLSARVKKFIFKWAKSLPAVRRQIESEMGKMKESFEEEFGNSVDGIPYLKALPEEGLSHHKILDETKLHLNLGDLDWAGGAMSGTVYNSSKEIISTTRKITEALRNIPGIQIVGSPDVSVVAFDSKDFNIYGLSDGMKERGWAQCSPVPLLCSPVCYQ